jgi:hypothetical protein
VVLLVGPLVDPLLVLVTPELDVGPAELEPVELPEVLVV